MPNINPTSSEVAPVLEASTATASLSRPAATAKLILGSTAATTQATASFWCCASLVGFLFSRQCGLTFLLVLLQQFGSLLFLQLSKDDLVEALSLFGQRVETCDRKQAQHDQGCQKTTIPNGGKKKHNICYKHSLYLMGFLVLNIFFTFHFEDSVLRHFLAIALNLLLDPLLIVIIRGADHHSLTLKACEQTHLPLLARGRQVSLERGNIC